MNKQDWFQLCSPTRDFREILRKYEEEIKMLQEACTVEMERVKPILSSAIEGVNSLQRGDIYDLKGLTKSHEGVDLTMQAVLLLLKVDVLPNELAWDAVKRQNIFTLE